MGGERDQGKTALRNLPAVSRLLADPVISDLLEGYPRPVVVEVVRQVLEEAREQLKHSVPPEEAVDRSVLLARVQQGVQELYRPSLQRVINATGVVLHTNLGRALLADTAAQAALQAAQTYSNLELDLASGQRGSRYQHVRELLRRLTGMESALVVNNNAAAVLLALTALASGRQVIVSRGELVEIGGAFRVPEVMAQSGAQLVEVGTTNRTYARDYQAALTADTALLLSVHSSNYRVVGFTCAPSLAEMVEVGHQAGVPVMQDLGSGCLVDLSPWGVTSEPTVTQAVAAGVDLITFSGDKLLGGPQAGIIIGQEKYLAPIRRHPLNRALRIDKLTLAALEATLRLYLDPQEALRSIPTLAMLTVDPATLKGRALLLAGELKDNLEQELVVTVEPGEGQAGGGSLPEIGLAGWVLKLHTLHVSAAELSRRLRQGEPPILVRVQEQQAILDVRTIQPGEEGEVVQGLKRALNP